MEETAQQSPQNTDPYHPLTDLMDRKFAWCMDVVPGLRLSDAKSQLVSHLMKLKLKMQMRPVVESTMAVGNRRTDSSTALKVGKRGSC
jgi:hypothetical protein